MKPVTKFKKPGTRNMEHGTCFVPWFMRSTPEALHGKFVYISNLSFETWLKAAVRLTEFLQWLTAKIGV